MTTIDLLNEVLKDPMFRDKYNISDEDLVNVSLIRPPIIGLLRW